LDEGGEMRGRESRKGFGVGEKVEEERRRRGR